MIRLRLWANLRPMGWFGHSGVDYFFEYDTQWLELPGGFVLAPQFPLQATRYAGSIVRNFFENLLPEGTVLDDVLSAIAQSTALRNPNTLELLGHLGQDLPGVLSLLPEALQPHWTQQYQPLPFETLNQRLHSHQPLLVSNDRTTMSLAGAQEKMGLRWDAKRGTLMESDGLSPSTHILKPDTRQPRYQPSAINEYACMKLARALKLPVPDVWLLRVPQAAYVVKRYDRLEVAGNIVSLHQFDGCQLLGHGAGWKYQRQGELVSIPKLVAALRQLPVRGADLLQLQQWVMFNYLIGNADAHAKNLSVLVDAAGYRLAPFYDLLCVRVYGDTGLALFIGDDDNFDAVGRHSWEALCQDCGFRLPETLKGFRKMATTLLPAWKKVVAQTQKTQQLTEPEAALLERMTTVFEAHCNNALSMTEGKSV